MKIQFLIILVLAIFSFAKSYTVLDNRFNTPVESVLVVRLADSAVTYTDSLGVFEFDEIIAIQKEKEVEYAQKWVDASGRFVTHPDPLKMKAFEVSNSEVLELNSFRKVSFDFGLTRSGYDAKSVNFVDSVIVLDKQVLGDSVLYSRIYNDVYKRRLYAWQTSYDSMKAVEELIINSIPTEPQSYRDSLNLIRDSIFQIENSSVGWIKVDIQNSLFDSIWVINERELGYAIKGDTSSQCEQGIYYSYSFSDNKINSIGNPCFVSPIGLSSMVNVEVRKEELNITNKVYETKQVKYAQFTSAFGTFKNIGYEAFNSFIFSFSEILPSLIEVKLETRLMWEIERNTCNDQNWNNRFYFESNELKNTITQPENCKWITE